MAAAPVFDRVNVIVLVLAFVLRVFDTGRDAFFSYRSWRASYRRTKPWPNLSLRATNSISAA